MEKCQKCGAPPHVMYRDQDGRTKCQVCAHIAGTPLPCEDCDCRGGCIGHPDPIVKGMGARRARWCHCAVKEVYAIHGTQLRLAP